MLYRRSVFLINKPFQIRFAFYVCSWLIALSFVYPLIIFNLFTYLMRYLALDPLGPAVAALETTRQELLWLLLLMELVFLSLTFLISIFMSHKIVGPLYKLGRFFREAGAGNLDQSLGFRKRDYFHDLAEEYNAMMGHIRQRMKTKSNGIDASIQRLEKALPMVNPEIRLEIEATIRTLREAQNNS
jgi:methyl-accepting chemotaxis protein